MKKNILYAVIVVLLSCSYVSAQDSIFDSVKDISAYQRQQLDRVEFGYKQQNETLERSIANYKTKLEQVKHDTEKTGDQISLLTSAYERNILLLQKQQKQLEEKTEKSYQTILNEQQYNSYKMLKSKEIVKPE